MGNLCRDVEMRYTPKGTAVAQINIAINHSYKTEAGEKKEEVTFVDCEAWGRTAEIIAQYAGKKGNPLMIEGRLKLDQWDDKTTQQKRSKLKVVIENIQLIGSKSDAQESAPRPAARPLTTPDAAPLPEEEKDCPF